MERLIVNVNEEQKETLMKLFEMLHITVEVDQGSDKPEGSQEQLVKALNDCRGMWKDVDIDFKEYREQAWGGRGVL